MAFLALVTTLALAAAPKEPPPPPPMPTLAKEPVLDGDLKDFAPALELKMPPPPKGATATLKARAGFKKDTLYVAADVTDDTVIPDDVVDIMVYFPESGTTSRGFVYRFNKDGLTAPHPELGPPGFAQVLLRGGTKMAKKDKGFTLEVAIPAHALPRFQAVKPLVMSLCVEYRDMDSDIGDAVKLNNCPKGVMLGGDTRLPDELRKNLKVLPPADAEGVEAREKGWVAYSKLHYPMWALGDEAMTKEVLESLVAPDGASVNPKKVALNIPETLNLNNGWKVLTVLTGENPFAKEPCLMDKELRLAMYAVKGAEARRVLEWPAATCQLGRAMQFELSEDGNLSIGYTTGSTAHFTWTNDHFERSELGRAD